MFGRIILITCLLLNILYAQNLVVIVGEHYVFQSTQIIVGDTLNRGTVHVLAGSEIDFEGPFVNEGTIIFYGGTTTFNTFVQNGGALRFLNGSRVVVRANMTINAGTMSGRVVIEGVIINNGGRIKHVPEDSREQTTTLATNPSTTFDGSTRFSDFTVGPTTTTSSTGDIITSDVDPSTTEVDTSTTEVDTSTTEVDTSTTEDDPSTTEDDLSTTRDIFTTKINTYGDPSTTNGDPSTTISPPNNETDNTNSPSSGKFYFQEDTVDYTYSVIVVSSYIQKSGYIEATINDKYPNKISSSIVANNATIEGGEIGIIIDANFKPTNGTVIHILNTTSSNIEISNQGNLIKFIGQSPSPPCDTPTAEPHYDNQVISVLFKVKQSCDVAKNLDRSGEADGLSIAIIIIVIIIIVIAIAVAAILMLNPSLRKKVRPFSGRTSLKRLGTNTKKNTLPQ